MSRTGIAITPAMDANRARPHDAELRPAAELDKPWSGGASLLRSSARDMATYVAAHLGLKPTPLAPAMADVLKPRAPAPFVDAEQALGWLVYPGPQPMVFFAGATTGFCTAAAFDPATRCGVVVLSNAAELVDGFARHLLRPSLPLPPPAPKGEFAGKTPVEPFLGDYRLTGPLGPRLPAGMVVTVRREAAGLVLQIPGAPKAPLTRESETRFVVRGFNLSVDFTPDTRASPSLRLTLGGDSTPAERVR
jgi:CubicO group peptidase (beta-lactamase class C family)